MKVRELLKLLEDNHAANPSLITVAGKEGAGLRPGALNHILKKAGLK